MTSPPQRQPYELPRDQTESARLGIQHSIYIQTLGYILHPTIASSVPPNAHIADLGTGTGAWMIDLASENPDYTIQGMDISSDQFSSDIPKNCSFRVLNLLEEIPEDLKQRFDVVHLRLLTCGLTGKDWNLVALNALQILKPGGWIQWCESDFEHMNVLQNEPGVSREACTQILDYAVSNLKKVGKFQEESSCLKRIVGEAGFEVVGEDVVSSDRVPELRDPTRQIALDALTGIGKTLAKGTGGGKGEMTVEMMEKLRKKGQEELEGGKVYWRWSIHCVIGRKKN